MKVKVIGEVYRVLARGRPPIEVGSPVNAARLAMKMAVAEDLAVIIERVTRHSPVETIIGASTETVTGSHTILGPMEIARLPALSRYHPVNGWAVPDAIEIETA